MRIANCPADSALAATFDTNFVGASSLPSGWQTTAGSVSFNANGANFVINKQGDSPTIQTAGYFFFGYCEVKMVAASGIGIVSSIVMESDDLDEVDWEFLGGDTTQTETNYFGKGNTTTYDRAIYYPVSSPQTTQHSYAVNWTSSSIEWLIDGVVVRTLNYADANGGTNFPQTPMRLKIGIWAGGDPSNGPGTIEWSGGPTNYAAAPFTMTVQSINIVNYSPGSSYTYSDESGSWQSIKVTGGSGITGSNQESSDTSGSSSSSGSSASIASSSTADPATSTTLSGSSAIHVSTASSISTSTGGASTASSVPPVILASTISANTTNATHTASSAGVFGSSSTNNNTSNSSLVLHSAANNASIGTLASTTHTTSAATTSFTSSSGADNLNAKMSFAALFGFGLFAAVL